MTEGVFHVKAVLVYESVRPCEFSLVLRLACEKGTLPTSDCLLNTVASSFCLVGDAKGDMVFELVVVIG